MLGSGSVFSDSSSHRLDPYQENLHPDPQPAREGSPDTIDLIYTGVSLDFKVLDQPNPYLFNVIFYIII